MNPIPFEIISLVCSYQAEVCAAGELADGDIDMFMDLLAELRAHENEIQKSETRAGDTDPDI